MQQSGEQSTAHGGEEDEVLTETDNSRNRKICLPRRESRERREPSLLIRRKNR